MSPAPWQPIDTAPMDGTRIRLGHQEVPGFGVKDPHGFGAVYGWWDGQSWQMSSFFIVPGGRFGLLSRVPTHWMPLPEGGAA